ncbi:hypothetical protein B4110_2074 [Parageobacillus toebii]|uniref:Uncharacterized protein n=1 Tax=Parageobacillus toebii TaxID=153151 RepID=A0A150N732_9BACL|nr:hypothetical protein B4110_2074 [Parageobacillus toebii]
MFYSDRDEKVVMIIARKVEVVPFRDEWTTGRYLFFFL